MCKISIIVPVYNVEKYLRKCIDSILNQSITDIEVILVDDGSTDTSGIICDEYKEKDYRVKVIHKKNGGLSSARNKGLDVAHGKYIGFVDSDDWIDSDMYEVLLNDIEKYNCDISTCSISIINDENNKIIFNDKSKIRVVNKDEVIKLLLKGEEVKDYFCDKLFSKELFKEVRFPEGRIYEDTFCQFKVFNLSNKIVINSISKYNYRMTQNSISRSGFSAKDFDLIEATNEIIKFSKCMYPHLTQLSEFKRINCYFILISKFNNSNLNNNSKEYKLLVDKINLDFFTNIFNKYINNSQRFHLILMRLNRNIYWKFLKLKRK